MENICFEKKRSLIRFQNELELRLRQAIKVDKAISNLIKVLLSQEIGASKMKLDIRESVYFPSSHS